MSQRFSNEMELRIRGGLSQREKGLGFGINLGGCGV